MRIALLGGTFDPVHPAHTTMAQYLLTSHTADKVLFLPAPVPPHKAGLKVISPCEHRRAMLELILSDGMEICDIEQKREGKSYTFDTMTELSKRYPDDEFFWVIGSDSLRQLHTWHRAQELVERFSFLTFPRGGETLPDEAELRQNWSKELTKKLLGTILHQAPVLADSSTEIRERIRENGPDGIRDLVNEKVFNYILTHKLYMENTTMSEQEETTSSAIRKPTPLEAAEFCEKTLYERKAENMLRFDMHGLNWAQSDYYIVCTGISTPHLGALAERVTREMRREFAIRPIVVDGNPQSQWVIVDFGMVIIHILTQEARERYQLEELWNDGKKLDVIKRLDEEREKLAKETK